ncbi:MAG TPA: hypothetical protein VJ250_08850 [Nitrososphaeraceae archaeon]|nr:hypothetical protein [Nitrososphaeraceae archaeon]
MSEDEYLTNMSNETIGKYLLKVQQETIDGEVSYVDMYKIGQEMGLVDKIQTDHIVEILLKDGYIINGKENSKIRLTDEGRKRISNNQT